MRTGQKTNQQNPDPHSQAAMSYHCSDFLFNFCFVLNATIFIGKVWLSANLLLSWRTVRQGILVCPLFRILPIFTIPRLKIIDKHLQINIMFSWDNRDMYNYIENKCLFDDLISSMPYFPLFYQKLLFSFS